MLFVNYRIKDSNETVGHLEGSLIEHFGSDAIFRDKGKLKGGDKWAEEIESKARSCQVMLVVIGKGWQMARYGEKTPAKNGDLRLRDPIDWVRREIIIGLNNDGCTVIPVLLEDTELPPREWLVVCDLDRLCESQIVRLSADSYSADFEKLVVALRKNVPSLLSLAEQKQIVQEDEREATNDRWLQAYLDWVIKSHDTLELLGAKGNLPVKLEKVFVALRGDRANAYEIASSQDLLEQDLIETYGDEYRRSSKEERQILRAKFFRSNSAHIISMRGRDRIDGSEETNYLAPVTLGEAFREERYLVILGDPGSGKTTLARWIALKLAMALSNGDSSQVKVPANQINPETSYDRRSIEIGPPRLPILVRVSEFAQALATAQRENQTITLVEWLCNITWNKLPPTAGRRIPVEALNQIFLSHLDQGKAVVILDGLDEITETSDRVDVVQAVKQFFTEWVPKPVSLSQSPESTVGPIAATPPHKTGGNQVVITSRIAGYHAVPIRAESVTHVTIEPMRRPAVEHFCDMWMHAVYEQIEKDQPEAIRAKHAKTMAKSLKASIYNPERTGIAEIASNPLLVTILASLYRENGSELPGTRVELYQTAIEMLIENLHRSQLTREKTLTKEEILYVLDPIAAHIHAHYPTGLIEGSELSELVTEHLAAYRGWPDDNPPPRLREDVRKFIETVRDNVGLLASRGERLYGFLHLTFQEYLAGRRLVSNRSKAVAEIMPHLGDPRWREPILLALGHAVQTWSLSQRRQFLNELLLVDDPLGAFLPQTSLLIVDALTEMSNVPEDSFKRLVSRLLSAYADRRNWERFPILRRRLEDSFLHIRTVGNVAWMDEVLSKAIASQSIDRTNSTADLACAAATIVRENEWFSAQIAQALPNGLKNDSQEWGWSIERAIRELISPKVPTVQASVRGLTCDNEKFSPLPIAPNAEIKAIQQKLRQIESDSQSDCTAEEIEQTITALLKDLDSAKRRFSVLQYKNINQLERLEKRYRVAEVAESNYKVRQLLQDRQPLQTRNLPLRLFLERDQSSQQYILSSYHWLCVIAGIYGGYSSCNSDLIDREQVEILSFLQQSEDSDRDWTIDADTYKYAGWFGNTNITYTAAVYMDNKMGERGTAARKPVSFSPEYIYRSSTLDRTIVSLLQSKAQSSELVDSFENLWNNSDSIIAQADAVIGLVSLGEDISIWLKQALSSASRTTDAKIIINHLQRVLEFSKDSVYRARQEILKDLTTLQESDSELWIDIVDTVYTLLCSSSRLPLSPSELIPHAPDSYVPVLESDRLYGLLDSVRQTANDRQEEIDGVISAINTAEDFISFLLHMHKSPNYRAGTSTFPLSFELIPPNPSENTESIPVEALSILSNIHVIETQLGYDSTVFTKALPFLKTLSDENRDLRPELWGTCAYLGLKKGAYLFSERIVFDQDTGVIAPISADAADSYYQARSLVAGLPYDQQQAG